jgi:hypothetical protein
MSGTTPHQAFTVMASFGGQDCRITINLAVIDALQAEIPVTCEDAM